MIKSVLGKLIAGLFILAMSGALNLNYGKGTPQRGFPDRRNMEFRYAIVFNQVRKLPFDKDRMRELNVLLEERAFSEDNLKKLLGLLSKRYPAPTKMHVSVYTSLEQVPTPEEQDQGGRSETEGNPEMDRHHRAILERNQQNQVIRYSTGLPVNGLKTIITGKLKGPRESGHRYGPRKGVARSLPSQRQSKQ